MLSLPLLALTLTGCIPVDTAATEPGTDEVVFDPASDDDGDGLTYAEEQELGTDADSDDSDNDDFTDGDEVDAGTNPMWKWSHVFEEGDYLVGNCPEFPDEGNSGPTGVNLYDGVSAAYQEGDIMHNLAEGGWDQYGQEIPVYSFCGNYTLVTQSAEWCGPCQALAATMADDTENVRKKYPNFTFYEFLIQDNYGATPDDAVLRKWSRNYGLEGIPVVAPPDNTADEVLWTDQTGYEPCTTLLAPNGQVIWSVVNHPDTYYITSASEIETAIKDYESSL